MAKINHPNFNDSISSLLTEAEARGVIQLKFESEIWEGSQMLVGDQLMRNFGTCGYLGLEFHDDLISKSIEFTKKFGTQFSVSRTYLTSRDSIYLEDLLSQIFLRRNVITFTSTTMLHAAIIPIIVDSKDLVILDQQCHASIQTATQALASKNIPVEIIRHSNLEMLEKKIKDLRNKHDKIWYMIDGVYSMFGDLAPIAELNRLMEIYPQLHLYIDDAHGMSWHGQNGCGRIFESCLDNERTMYVSTMAKGFGAMGGIAVFPTREMYEKVKIYGGSLTHSHPIPPPMLGASIASAEIHLSSEIYKLQSSLKEKLQFANELFMKTDLPIISNPETPIFFLGTGQPAVGYNLNKRILDEGYYVNIGMFPAVPIKNTGLRFTITNHNSKQDIENLVNALTYHFPRALEEENKSVNDVRRAFRLDVKEENGGQEEIEDEQLEITFCKSISEIKKADWNFCFEGKGNFDYDSLLLLEKSFQGNSKKEENWSFYYLIIRNQEGEILLATFFTLALMKDDLFSCVEISKSIELKRILEPYYLCSKTLIMGSLFSEGEHLFLKNKEENNKVLLKIMFARINEIQKKEQIQNVILRDFSEEDKCLFSVFHDEAYFSLSMPNTNVIFDLQKDIEKPYLELLSAKAKRNIKYEVLKNQNKSSFVFKNKLDENELKTFYDLYSSVSAKNLAINIFKYPYKLFLNINENEDWEFGILYQENSSEILGIVVCFKNEKSYFPLTIGIDYEKNEEYVIYKTILFNLVMKARERGFEKIYFGLSADFEKKKLGAEQIKKSAFISSVDQFNFEVIEHSFN